MMLRKMCSKKVVISWLAGVLFLTGCGPPGPRALLKGERLIEQGKYEKAITSLQQATQLLPKNAQAWNYLGLAYHGNHQPLLAVRAYRQALTIDSSLAAARYNLGCAYLDNNDLGNAIEQLTSFTYVHPNSPEGWVKLGSARFRTNHLDMAERSFRVALDLQTNNFEALNGLGLVQYQKRRYAEALNSFNLAIAQNPSYAPAILNAAIAAHQVTASKPTALQLYRRYLALKPAPPDAANIALVANQLDAELNPPPRPPPVQVASQSAQPKTNPVAPPAHVATVSTTAATNPPAATVRTTQVASAPAQPAGAVPPLTNNAFALTTLISTPKIVTPSPAERPLEVTRVDNNLVVVAPQEIGSATERSTVPEPAPPPPPPPSPPVIVSTTVPTNSSSTLTVFTPTKPKKGIWQRLNPFTGKPKTSNAPPEIIAMAAPPSPKVVVLSSNPPPEAIPETPVVTRRYEYQFPAKRPGGNRTEAQKYVREGVGAQRAGLQSEAIARYKKAAEVDPSFFDARLNLALAAYGLGNWEEALSASEHALAIRPESVDARFWFASALREAKFPQDAADQWVIILQNHPDDARVHLALAKLYAGQLNQTQLAREHYIKVLDLAPNHPDAARIRFWIAGNPPK